MAYAADTLRDRASEQVVRLHGVPEHVTINRCALFRRRRSATAASLLAGGFSGIRGTAASTIANSRIGRTFGGPN